MGVPLTVWSCCCHDPHERIKNTNETAKEAHASVPPVARVNSPAAMHTAAAKGNATPVMMARMPLN